MKRLLSLLLTLTLAFAWVNQVQAVNFQDELKKLAEDNAKGYIGPFATAFGTAMNSGLYHTAKPHKFLGVDGSIKISIIQIADEDLTFDFVLPSALPVTIPNVGTRNLNANILYPDREGPTMFGESKGKLLQATDGSLESALLDAGISSADIENLHHSGEFANVLNTLNADSITTPPGLGLDVLPLFMPQASIGLPFGTEVLLRIIPEQDLGNLGKIKMLGWGVKHSISQWIPVPLLGLDISGQYSTQKLEVGPVISNNTALNLQVSRRFGFMLMSITPYAGIGTESSDIEVDYTINNPGNPFHGQNVAFNLDGENGGRMTAGARLQLMIFTFNADINIGKYTAYSAGFGVTFR